MRIQFYSSMNIHKWLESKGIMNVNVCPFWWRYWMGNVMQTINTMIAKSVHAGLCLYVHTNMCAALILAWFSDGVRAEVIIETILWDGFWVYVNPKMCRFCWPFVFQKLFIFHGAGWKVMGICGSLGGMLSVGWQQFRQQIWKVYRQDNELLVQNQSSIFKINWKEVVH